MCLRADHQSLFISRWPPSPLTSPSAWLNPPRQSERHFEAADGGPEAGPGRQESPRTPEKQIPASSGVAYQMIGTNPESVIVESAVMSGRPKARAVATMSRSEGSARVLSP